MPQYLIGMMFHEPEPSAEPAAEPNGSLYAAEKAKCHSHRSRWP
jgi:hypothetical protein